MKAYMKIRHLVSVCFLSTMTTTAVFSQQVFEGTHAVPPLFEGQTRAPLAPKSAKFIVSDFVTGLNRPWAMAHMPNGNMMITEVPGRIRIITPDGTVSKPIKGVPEVRAWGSRGLNDVILDPDFDNNRKIYFAYLAPPKGIKSDNSDANYQQFATERAAWNKLTREQKAKTPWGHWRVASATLSKNEKKISNLKVIVETTPTR
ncbi:MAG: glucose/arabinose dehydrogenase, partial [Candidatus Azotimanducaceae bacterium]